MTEYTKQEIEEAIVKVLRTNRMGRKTLRLGLVGDYALAI